MIKYFICFFVLAFVIFACKDDKKLPSGILKQKQMTDVLWDVMRADAYTKNYIAKDSTKNSLAENVKLQQQIFAIHHTTKEEFYTSFAYYKNHTELMKVVLDSVTTKANFDKYNFSTKKENEPITEK